MSNLRQYCRRRATEADKAGRDWDDSDPQQNAAFRAGMWYAYRDVERLIGNYKPVSPVSENPGEAEFYERIENEIARSTKTH